MALCLSQTLRKQAGRSCKGAACRQARRRMVACAASSHAPWGAQLRRPPHAASLAAGLLAVALTAAGTSPAASASTSDGPSLRSRLQEYTLFQSLFGGPSSPTQRLLGRVQAVQDVLQRVERLVRLGEYGAAGALLRGRETSQLVMDLGYAAEAYRLLPQQAGQRVLAALAALRAALATADEALPKEEVALSRVRAAGAALRAVADVLMAAGE